MTVFGDWTSPRHIELAYIDHIERWITTYIAEAERQFGIDARSLPVPARGQFTVHRSEFEKWPEDQTPAILVLAPGLAGDPRREADKSLTAPIAIGFGIIAAAGAIFEDAAAEIAQIIGVSIREIVLNLRPIGLDVAGVELLDEQYGDVEKRSLGSSRLIFRVWVKNWSPGPSGPIDRVNPPDDPYLPSGNYPTVQPGKIFIELNNTRRID